MAFALASAFGNGVSDRMVTVTANPTIGGRAGSTLCTGGRV
jgi:hypothetical protein